MSRLASFKYNPNTQEVVVADITSHGQTERLLNLPVTVWHDGHYFPNGEIECKLPENKRHSKTEAYVKERWPRFVDFFNWAMDQNIVIISRGLDFCGCDIKGVKLPTSISGSLDLRGCDLKGVKLPTSVGGSLDLGGCDLKGIKLPTSVGGWIDLSGCDLKGIKLPKKLIGKIII